MKTSLAKTNEGKPRNPAPPDRNVLVTVSLWQTPSGRVRTAISQLRNLSLLRHALLCPLLILVLFGCATNEASFTPEPEATIGLPTETSLAPDRENSTPRATQRPPAFESEILNAVVPPCTPYPGSMVDPCERRDNWPPIDPYTHVEYELIEPAPSLQDVYLSIIDLELYNSAPHFVVRAIPIPGTTRCGTVKSFGTSFSAVDGNREGLFDHTHCWVDLAVNEYIVNSGPARLTIDIGVWIPNYEQDGLDREARVFGDRFEGWEWIITLTAPWDPNNASWRIGWLQDVQMREDGTVVVVSWEKKDYMLVSQPEFRSINLERAEVTLSEYRREANSAYQKFFETTGGRIFVGNDINGNPLPSLAQDATDDSLRKYFREIKVIDATEYTAKSPPPVPGEGDPNPAGLTVNDVIATRVAGGVTIPGGLEDTPTPVSALGDEPTATATVEPTATADATANQETSADEVAEPTVTPEFGSRLESIIPPCVPFPGSVVDPCKRRDRFDTFTPGVEAAVQIPDLVETIKQGFLRWSDRPHWATHFVVRATVVPGSTRCGPMVPVTSHLSAYKSGDSNSMSLKSFCYVDLSVNEYLIGQGPSRISTTTGVNMQGYNYDSECGELCRVHGAEEVRATGIEGVEWILYLGGPRQLGQGTWDIDGVFDVQRREDGTVVVVNRYKGIILEHSKPENYDVNLSRLEQPLDMFTKNVTEAFAAFVELTGGRTGTVNDMEGRPPPKLASDASPFGFSDFLARTRLIEGIPAAPPPVPGENDPNPDGLRINDVIATRVAGGERISGGLEDTPTPVSALGDEPTATATGPTPESEESDEED